MANTGRYVYTPAAGKVRQKSKLAERIRRWWNKKDETKPDVFRVTGFEPAVYPSWTKK